MTDDIPTLSSSAKILTRNDASQLHPPPNLPDRGGRSQFGANLSSRIEHIEQEAAARPRPPLGIKPHLVFRVPLMPSTLPFSLVERLRTTGANVCSNRTRSCDYRISERREFIRVPRGR